MMNVAKALASAGSSVYLCSSKLSVNVDRGHMREVLPNIFVVGEEYVGKRSVPYRIVNRYFHLFLVMRYLFVVLSIVRNIEGEKVFYLYPQPEASMDSAALLILKWLGGFRLFCDVNELRITNLENDTPITNPLIRLFTWAKYVYIEKLTHYYDGLVVISTNLERYFSRYSRNMMRVPILCEPIGDAKSHQPLWKDGEPFRMCFTGMVSFKKEGLGTLIESLAILKDTFLNFELCLYGPITELDEMNLERLVEHYSLNQNIFYNGVVAQAEIPGKLRNAHLLLLVRPHNHQTHYGFSTKLSEYVSSGVPVLLTDVSDNGLYFKDGFSAFVLPNAEKDLIAEKILFIVKNYNATACFVAGNALTVAKENFDYRNYSIPLGSFLFSHE
jgi:glycosyltransferase involved in cell wall biosynthesis